MKIASVVLLALVLATDLPGQSTGGGAAARLETVPLPGRGLSQHPFLYCGEWQNRGKSDQTIFVVRGGKVTWQYAISWHEELGDCTMLSNGDIVFSRRNGASEVTPDKRIVWSYDAPPHTEVDTAQPIGRDRVLIMHRTAIRRS